ncbi:MAG TPA: aminoacyl-tRNA hydrolase [Lacipirellulaceae bacterium]|jgi:PTH1 family peptidyl-tRNA hydrolase
MKLIVGLGNPGKKYEQTRHNVGFAVVDRLAARFGDGAIKDKFAGRLMEATIAGERALLLWPQTLMNLSGESVGPAFEFYKFELGDVLVVCDDFNLPLGKLRFRREGSAGGQKGLADIIRRLGTEDFGRLRLGIGPVPEEWDAADYVLGRFKSAERDEIDQAVDRAIEGVECWAASGIAVSMNRFN